MIEMLGIDIVVVMMVCLCGRITLLSRYLYPLSF